MADCEGFGVLLEQLAERRQLDLETLARSADVSESELLILFRGDGPRPSLLRRLAPALGLHIGNDGYQNMRSEKCSSTDLL